jgi:hypothetical protein
VRYGERWREARRAAYRGWVAERGPEGEAEREAVVTWFISFADAVVTDAR